MRDMRQLEKSWKISSLTVFWDGRTIIRTKIFEFCKNNKDGSDRQTQWWNNMRLFYRSWLLLLFYGDSAFGPALTTGPWLLQYTINMFPNSIHNSYRRLLWKRGETSRRWNTEQVKTMNRRVWRKIIKTFTLLVFEEVDNSRRGRSCRTSYRSPRSYLVLAFVVGLVAALVYLLSSCSWVGAWCLD